MSKTCDPHSKKQWKTSIKQKGYNELHKNSKKFKKVAKIGKQIGNN